MTRDAHAQSYLLRGTAAGHSLRVLALDTTQVVEEARLRHDLSATATAALGRTLSGSLLLAQVLGKRDSDRITVRIQGDGPIGWIVAEGSVNGEVRGYVRTPGADLPLRDSDGKLDVRGVVGTEGELAVMRLLDNAEPYTGSVPLQSGEIAEDLAYYLAASEQIPSALLLGVYEEGGRVARSGGLLVQALPGASDETLSRLEANVRGLGLLTDTMGRIGLLGAVQAATEGLDLEMLPDALPLRLACRCSEERALASLAFFGPEERQEMIEEGGQEVVCHWCSTRYHLSPDAIRALDEEQAEERAQA